MLFAVRPERYYPQDCCDRAALRSFIPVISCCVYQFGAGRGRGGGGGGLGPTWAAGFGVR